MQLVGAAAVPKSGKPGAGGASGRSDSDAYAAVPPEKGFSLSPLAGHTLSIAIPRGVPFRIETENGYIEAVVAVDGTVYTRSVDAAPPADGYTRIDILAEGAIGFPARVGDQPRPTPPPPPAEEPASPAQRF